MPCHATTRVGGGVPTAATEGCERSYRLIWSRWCMLGNEDEPSGLDAWAARSLRAGTRRAYAQKLAKIAEFQEASGETSLAGVPAEFLAAKAEAGERQSTLRGHKARDNPPCVDIMQRCEPLRISDGLGLSSINSTSALRMLRLRWASSPICPLRVCASS